MQDFKHINILIIKYITSYNRLFCNLVLPYELFFADSTLEQNHEFLPTDFITMTGLAENR